MIKGQGHLKAKVKAVQYQGQLLKINFRCEIVNVFVIYVLRGWYAFDWKAFLLETDNSIEPAYLIKTPQVEKSDGQSRP